MLGTSIRSQLTPSEWHRPNGNTSINYDPAVVDIVNRACTMQMNMSIVRGSALSHMGGNGFVVECSISTIPVPLLKNGDALVYQTCPNAAIVSTSQLCICTQAISTIEGTFLSGLCVSMGRWILGKAESKRATGGTSSHTITPLEK